MRKRVAKVKKPTYAVVLNDHRTWPSSRRLPCGRRLGPPRKAWTWETCVRGLLRFPPYFPPLKAVDAGNAVSPNQQQARQGGHQLFAAPNHSHVCLLAGWVVKPAGVLQWLKRLFFVSFRHYAFSNKRHLRGWKKGLNVLNCKIKTSNHYSEHTSLSFCNFKLIFRC